LQEALLCLLAHASGSPIARQLAIFTYLAIGEVALRMILQQEEAAAATLARYACLAAKAEQRRVSSSGRNSTADSTACLCFSMSGAFVFSGSRCLLADS
jgi:hypothetical protein